MTLAIGVGNVVLYEWHFVPRWAGAGYAKNREGMPGGIARKVPGGGLPLRHSPQLLTDEAVYLAAIAVGAMQLAHRHRGCKARYSVLTSVQNL